MVLARTDFQMVLGRTWVLDIPPRYLKDPHITLLGNYCGP